MRDCRTIAETGHRPERVNLWFKGLLAVTLLTLTLALALVACDGGTMTSAADTETTAASGSGGISSACDTDGGGPD